MRNELNLPLNLATLFVHIKVGDYVPDAFAGLYFMNEFYPKLFYSFKEHAERVIITI